MKALEVVGGTTLSVGLFEDVTNARELLELMQAGTLAPEVALLNASLVSINCHINTLTIFFSFPIFPYAFFSGVFKFALRELQIPDVFPVLAAAHKTFLAKSRQSLTTRTAHSELVYNYSGSKHISESLKRCGISDSSTYILVARFDASADELLAIGKLIKGKEIDLEELGKRANLAQIQKHYKISGLELGISSLADAIACRIAARDAL